MADRDGARHAGQIAADHQHDAELAERVREAQDRSGHDAVDRQRQQRREEKVRQRDAPSVADASSSARIDLRKRGGDRLHGEGQTVQNRREDQRLEREGEAVTGPGRPGAPIGLCEPMASST